MPVLWGQMFTMKLGTGILVFCAVAVPWYLTLSLFDGVDDESKLFWYRFFIHDHLNRLSAGVHTTTPGGTFTYFIEQGGFAIFPWVALLPGAFAVVSRLRAALAGQGGPPGAHRRAVGGLLLLPAGLLGHQVPPLRLPGAAGPRRSSSPSSSTGCGRRASPPTR